MSTEYPAEAEEMVARDSDPPLQFSLRTMFLATSVVAVSLGLVYYLTYLGALVIFLTAWAESFSRGPKELRMANRAIDDLIWGIGLPVVCLLLDPFLLQNPHGPLFENLRHRDFALNELNGTVYFGIAIQFAALMASMMLPANAPPALAATLSGILTLGALAAALLAVVLFLPALIGTLLIFGVLGFTPGITAFVYFRRSLQVLKSSAAAPRTVVCCGFVAGVAIALGAPLSVWFLWRWLR